MRTIKALALLAGSYLLQRASAQGNLVPLPGTTHKRKIANLTFYTLSFDTPQNAPIYRFESTLIIPTGSRPDAKPDGAVNAIWPGLQEGDLLQNVLTNQKISSGNKPAQWFHLPFFCCSKAGNISEEVQVYPGDALTSIYVWDIPHNVWLDSWTLATANEAVKAGKSGFTGGLIYDPKTGGGKGNYTHAILAIELQGLGKWDWGAFTWRNVIVQARTKETAWCTKFSSSNLHYHTSTPVATTDGDLTTCYIATVVFDGPDEKGRN